MANQHDLASRILVNSIEQRSDNEVRVIFKEHHLLVPDKPKTQYLLRFLAPLGICVEAGDPIGSTPFLPLTLTRKDAGLSAEEIAQVLGNNNEVELSPQVRG